MLGLLKKNDAGGEVAEELSNFDLPPFPQVLWHVLELLRDPESSLISIGETIALDPGLTVKLLSTVNSAAFGLRQKVSSPNHAVSLLGRHQVECLVLGLATQRLLPDQSTQGFKPDEYWKGAAMRATLARSLAEGVCPNEAGFNFTAGLLQNMAIPILAHHGPEEYGETLQAAQSGNEDLENLEHEQYGWTHAEVGAAMGKRWSFPEELTANITDHHSSPTAGDSISGPSRLVAQISDLGSKEEFERLLSQMHEIYGVSSDVVNTAFDQALEEANELARILLSK